MPPDYITNGSIWRLDHRRKWIHLYFVSVDPPSVPTLEDTNEGQSGLLEDFKKWSTKTESSFWHPLKLDAERYS